MFCLVLANTAFRMFCLGKEIQVSINVCIYIYIYLYIQSVVCQHNSRLAPLLITALAVQSGIK